MSEIRNFIIVLGDQLNLDSAVFNHFDKEKDLVWMAEADSESKYVPSTKMRTAVFLSAMRHFRESLKQNNIPLKYYELKESSPEINLLECLEEDLKNKNPDLIKMIRPGEWRLYDSIKSLAKKLDYKIEFCTDNHFLTSDEDFKEWAEGRKEIRLEYFYRKLRKKYNILIDKNGNPEGGSWNFDKENRNPLAENKIEKKKKRLRIQPDSITKEVLTLVEKRFLNHYGSCQQFDWAVTKEDAEKIFKHFIDEHLENFGRYQDAMWRDEPFLYHSLISSALNLKLINPQWVIDEVIKAYEKGSIPINSAEGFIRQVLGWREFVRGIYWAEMPEYLELNELKVDNDLPSFYWTGETEYECLRQTINQSLDRGYAHHIQRLMITGLYGLLVGVHPQQMHRWYLAVYVDAVEWVELPNTLGMSQFADGGLMASKPYAASGKYISRMSNYCDVCPKNPNTATGEDACPFNALYWDFLHRNKEILKSNRRMNFQLKNLDRKNEKELADILKRAAEIRAE